MPGHQFENLIGPASEHVETFQLVVPAEGFEPVSQGVAFKNSTMESNIVCG